MDLIDRQALLEQFRRKKCYESCGLFDICRVPCSVAKIILDAPTVETKRGEWSTIGLCSVCNGEAPYNESGFWYGSNFCPNCGVPMRGVQDGD